MQRPRRSSHHQISAIAAHRESQRALIEHRRVDILLLTPPLFSHRVLPNQRPLPVAPNAQHAIIARGEQRAEPRMERDLRDRVGVRVE